MSTPTYNGNPIVCLPFPPDWTTGPRLKVRHSTNIFEALDTSEERHRRFPRPLYGISFQTAALTPREQGSLRKLCETAQEQPVGVPLWTDAVRLTAAILDGEDELPVTSTSATLFQVFTYAILWSDYKTWEIGAVTSVAANLITLTAGTAAGWPINTLVMPFALGYAKRPDFASLSAGVSTIPIDFDEVWNRNLNQKGTLDA